MDDNFFNCFDATKGTKGIVNARVDIVKSSLLMEVRMKIEGAVEAICDRCLEEMELPISGELNLYAKYGEREEGNDDDFIILAQDDDYLDYRRYFSYDMEISSRQGQTEITAELSKKQGSASNGEKQTPYFIILAASLLQCYPANTCCARLAFIDEAFSALSRERIEQMVHYFEENHFQVFYAAPPEKINSIGQFIDSTVSLIVTGRYTNAVEGLVKQA